MGPSEMRMGPDDHRITRLRTAPAGPRWDKHNTLGICEAKALLCGLSHGSLKRYCLYTPSFLPCTAISKPANCASACRSCRGCKAGGKVLYWFRSCASPARSASGCWCIHPPGGLAGGLHRRQQQGDEDAAANKHHQPAPPPTRWQRSRRSPCLASPGGRRRSAATCRRAAGR